MKNVKAKFGRVVTNLPSNSFDPRKLNEHIKAMFPDYNNVRMNDRGNTKNDSQTINRARIREDRNTGAHVVPIKRSRYSLAIRSNDAPVNVYLSAENIEQVSLQLEQTPTNDAKILNQMNEFIHDKNRIIEDLSKKLKDSNEKLRSMNLKRDQTAEEVKTLKDTIKEMVKLNGDSEAKLQEMYNENAKLKESADLQSIKEDRSKEIAAIVESYKMKLLKMTEKVQRLDETKTRAELQFTIASNILKKTEQEINTLKKCTGCNKQLESFNRFCNQDCKDIW